MKKIPSFFVFLLLYLVTGLLFLLNPGVSMISRTAKYRVLLIAFLLSFPAFSFCAMDLSPSTGSELPYSVQTRKYLKERLFNNRDYIGGQVIAVRNTPGKYYSANYIDVGSLGGIKQGDVLALFTTHGEPVGFIRVVEAQRYTSSFEFVELTVNPTDDLTVKKVPQEMKNHLPSNLSIYPDMQNWKPGVRFVGTKKKGATVAALGKGKNEVASQPPLPPLPTESTATGANLPPLPSSSVVSGSSLPPLPEGGVASMQGGSLPPLPASNAPENNTNLPPLPASSGNTAEMPMPPMPGGTENAAALPPIGSQPSNLGTGAPELPPLPSTGAEANPSAMPGLPLDNSPASMPMPDLTPPSSLPPGAVDNGMPPLPATGNQDWDYRLYRIRGM